MATLRQNETTLPDTKKAAREGSRGLEALEEDVPDPRRMSGHPGDPIGSGLGYQRKNSLTGGEAVPEPSILPAVGPGSALQLAVAEALEVLSLKISS